MSRNPVPKDTQPGSSGHPHYDLYHQNQERPASIEDNASKNLQQHQRQAAYDNLAIEGRNQDVRSIDGRERGRHEIKHNQIPQARYNAIEGDGIEPESDRPRNYIQSEIQRSPSRGQSRQRSFLDKCPRWLKVLIVLILLVALGGFTYWMFFKRGKTVPLRKHKGEEKKEEKIVEQNKQPLEKKDSSKEPPKQEVKVQSVAVVTPKIEETKDKIEVKVNSPPTTTTAGQRVEKSQIVQISKQNNNKKQESKAQNKSVVISQKKQDKPQQKSQQNKQLKKEQKKEDKKDEKKQQTKQNKQESKAEVKEQKVEMSKIQQVLKQKPNNESKPVAPTTVVVEPVQDKPVVQIKKQEEKPVKVQIAKTETVAVTTSEEGKASSPQKTNESKPSESQNSTPDQNKNSSPTATPVQASQPQKPNQQPDVIVVYRGNKTFCPDNQFLLNGNCMTCPPKMVWSGLDCVLKEAAVKHLKRYI